MLDIDEVTAHLTQFGAYETPREVFLEQAKRAMNLPATWLDNNLPSDILRDEMKELSQHSESQTPRIRTSVVHL